MNASRNGNGNGNGGADESRVHELVAAGRASMPAAVARRLDASLREPLAGAREGAAAAPRRSRWFAAVLLAAGVFVTVAVFVSQRRHDDRATPADAPRQDAPARLDPLPPPQEPAPADPPGPARVLDAQRTLQRAPLVLVVDVTFPSGVPVRGMLRGKVLRVLQGDGVAPGQAVELRFENRQGGAEQTMLDVVDLARPGAGLPGPWLLAAAPAPEQPGSGPFRLAAALGTGLPGTPVLDAPPEVGATAPVAERVRAELAAALGSSRPEVRAGAVAALCRWDGAPLPRHRELLEDSPWHDPAIATQLVRLAQDEDPSTRMTLALAMPARAGADARRAVERLLFDRCQGIRYRAFLTLGESLGHVDPTSWFAPLLIRDAWWCELTFPPGFRRWELLAESAAHKDGVHTRTGVFLRQIDKPDARNYLLGAVGLGVVGDASVLPRLVGLCEADTPGVRAAAARSRVQLGDRAGYGVLRSLLTAADEKGAVYALDMLRTLDTPEALDAIAMAAKDDRPLVRALGAAGLRERRAAAPHMVDALLGDLRQDREEIVRIAARE